MTEPTIILNRYEIGSLIGRGGMADVFQGRDVQSGERVAIKRMRGELTYSQPESIERFRRESEVLSKLNHPNIVQMLGAGESDGQYYLVMEYVGGGTVADLLKRQPQLPLEHALGIGLELADALARTHHLKIIHRDIKPTNILLTEEGTPRLTDFGLAFSTGIPRLTQPGIAVGTWFYLSPEVCRGALPDERSDVWSFGITLYEMLSGRVPFYGDSPASFIRAIENDPLPSIIQFREDVPLALDKLIQHMLMRDASLRLDSFRQIGAEIERLLHHDLKTLAHHSAAISTPIEVQWTDEIVVETSNEPLPLLTKLSMPSLRPHCVVRPRLLQTLEQGLVDGHGFTLVSAPPGFGKTTLVTAWLKADARPVAWLSLDESDNDVVHFIRYLIASLQRVEPNIGKTTSLLLDSPQLPPVSALLTPLINEVARLVAVTLVLDDYHIITDARVHDTVRFLLEHLPHSLHLVIISREDPPLPLARFRVRDSMTEIRERDLRFSPEETGAFLNQTMNLNLPAGTAEQLVKRTEGWIAALQLAALALQQVGDDGQALIDDFAGDNRYIVDYLANEVLERQPPSVQDFLRRTSVLDQLSAPLCDAVLAIADSAAILDQLERSNLFLIPLDQRRRWYRYHALFANVLQLTVPAEEQAALHERASDWFSAHSGGLPAVRHALAAAKITHNCQQAISLILTYRQNLIDQGNLMTVLGWLNALPETALREHPELLIEKAWILVVVGESARAESLNAMAEPAWSRLTLANQGRLRLTQSFLALTRGELVQTLEFAQDAASLLIEPDQLNWRMIALWALAEAQERGATIPEAIASLREAASIGRGTASLMFNIMIEQSLATALNEHGERREAVSVSQLALSHFASEQGQAEPLTAILLCRLADLAYETNDLAGAMAYQQRAQALAERLGFDMVTATIEAITAKILVAEGDFDTALQHLQAAKSVSHESLADATWIDAIEGALHLRRGDVDAAQKWALQAGLQSDQLPHYLFMERHIVYARLLLAQHALEQARDWLERLDQFAEERGYGRWLISVRILRALADERLGDTRRALTFMADAVRLAASEDYIRAFLDEPQAVMALLHQVRAEAPAFVDAVLNAAPPSLPSGPGDTLSERELEVLHLLAAGLTNAKIAERLFLSTGTVKQHVNHIYEKLHVHSRTQAVAKAHDSKLIH